MAGCLNQITSLYRPAARGVVSWNLPHTKRRGTYLYGPSIRQFSSGGELIYGSRDWRMVRPATPTEVTWEKFHRNYDRQAMPSFIFNSRKEIGEEIWRKSLQHTANKMETLRVCTHNRGDDLWICEVKNFDIDVKITENKPVLEVVDDMKNEGLDDSFWSVRIVPAEPGEVCAVPELREAFPHQYTLLFKWHHGLFDGTSVAYFIRVYTEILDDVLSGKTVNDDIKLGNYLYDYPLQTQKEIEQALKKDPLRLNEEKERMLRITKKQPILYSAFPHSNIIQSTTRHVVRKVPISKLNTLHKYCKLNNMNMHAGIEALMNTALVEMVTDAGVDEDVFKINIRQSVNMRRYMKMEKDLNRFPMGFILGAVHEETFCKKLARKHFWEHAQEINKSFHFLLKNNSPIVESLVRPNLDPDELFKSPPLDYSDYGFINNLNMTPFMFYEGTQVQVTDMISYAIINNLDHPILFQFVSYRNLGQLTCSYDTAKVADDTAQELMDRIINVLDFVTK